LAVKILKEEEEAREREGRRPSINASVTKGRSQERVERSLPIDASVTNFFRKEEEAREMEERRLPINASVTNFF